MAHSKVQHLADEIVRRYTGGESTVAIAASLGVHNTVIGRILRKRGVNTQSVKTRRVEERIEEAIALHRSGKSVEEVASAFGVSHRVIAPLFRKHGVKLHKRCDRIPPETRKVLADEYKAGKSTYTLAKEHGLSADGVLLCIKAQGVTIRPDGYRNRRLSLNEAAFDEITEQSAYWVGFLMGDGCVQHTRSGTRVSVTLGETDRCHVEAFRDFLGSGHAICEAKTHHHRTGATHRQITFSVPSGRIAAALARFGIQPMKTHTAEVKELELNRHFWRGLIDADGSLMVNKGSPKPRPAGGFYPPYQRPVLSACGTEKLMKQCANFLSLITDDPVNARPSQSVWTVTVGGARAIVAIKALYEDCSIALPRKFEKAKELVARFDV